MFNGRYSNRRGKGNRGGTSGFSIYNLIRGCFLYLFTSLFIIELITCTVAYSSVLPYEIDEEYWGKITVNPSSCHAGEEGKTWTITYTAGPRGFWNWNQLKVAIWKAGLEGFLSENFPYFSPPQMSDPYGRGYVTLSSNAVGWIENENQCGNIFVQPIENLFEGDSLTIIYGDTSAGGEGAYAPFAAYEDCMTFEIINNKEKMALSCHTEVLPQDGSILEPSAPTTVKKSDTFELKVIVFDKYFNVDPSYVVQPDDWNLNSDIDFSYKLVSSSGGCYIFEVTIEETGVCCIEVSDGILLGTSNPIHVSNEDGYVIYWGDIHGHTTMSDGLLHPSSYLMYARDFCDLDFAAITDHDKLLTGCGWDTVRSNIESYNDPGNFVTFLGYEWTSNVWNHKIVWYKDKYDEVTVFTSRSSEYPWREAFDPAELEDCLEELNNFNGAQAVVASHHVNHGNAPDWGIDISDSLQRLVEIYSILGSSEATADSTWRMYGRGSYDVQWGLGVPYMVGIYGSGDTHGGHPGKGYGIQKREDAATSKNPAGLVAAIVNSDEGLTRESLWDALWNRRIYATSGERILVDFRIDGKLPGETVRTSELPVIEMNVAARQDLECIELIRNGTVIFYEQPPGRAFSTSFVDETFFRPSYYYLRATQKSTVENEGIEKAWTSPIWVEPQ